MSDRLLIIGKDGKGRFLLDEHDNIIDLNHEHDFSNEQCCTVCGLTAAQIIEETPDVRQD